MAKTLWNNDDEKILLEKEFFISKARVSGKLLSIMGEVDLYLRRSLTGHPVLGEILKNNSSKITRGENLNGTPYFVLDLPSLKPNSALITIRILIWWGNYITVNLLLSGTHLNQTKDIINENLRNTVNPQLYISIARNPWEHKIDRKNYISAGEWKNNNHKIGEYFKATIKIPLQQVATLEQVAASACQELLKLIK